MYYVRKITKDISWLGGSDRRVPRFESAFPVPDGMSYNAYFLDDENPALLDTVDKAVEDRFYEGLEHLLGGRKLRYVVVNHAEPDHTSTLMEVLRRHPEAQIVCGAMTAKLLAQFFADPLPAPVITVGEGSLLCTGEHVLEFHTAPMVHWPEVTVAYDRTDKVLFSADAFGTFGALSGNIFADEVDYDHRFLPEARRYYANIVGKYGDQVKALLKKAEGLDIAYLCPLHGPIWRKDLGVILDKYRRWANYIPEERAVMIAYASVYGNTKNAADILACELAEQGVRNIVMFDAAVTDPSYVVAEAFRCSHLVFASTTYNGGVFCWMETVLTHLAEHALQNRTVALIQNGSWAPAAGGLMRKALGAGKNMTFLEPAVTLCSSVQEEQRGLLCELARALTRAETEPDAPAPAPEKKKGFVCSVCGYIYEGDTLPSDFVCPLCKAGRDAFRPL